MTIWNYYELTNEWIWIWRVKLLFKKTFNLKEMQINLQQWSLSALIFKVTIILLARHTTDPYYFPDKFLVSQHNTAIMQKTRYPFNSDRAIITTTREFIARSSRLYRAFTFPVRAWLKPIWQCKITGTPGLKHCQFRTIQMAAAPIRRNVRARAPDFVNVPRYSVE